jgi:hypothetical protein
MVINKADARDPTFTDISDPTRQAIVERLAGSGRLRHMAR